MRCTCQHNAVQLGGFNDPPFPWRASCESTTFGGVGARPIGAPDFVPFKRALAIPALMRSRVHPAFRASPAVTGQGGRGHDPCLAMGRYGPRAPEEAKGAARRLRRRLARLSFHSWLGWLHTN